MNLPRARSAITRGEQGILLVALCVGTLFAAGRTSTRTNTPHAPAENSTKVFVTGTLSASSALIGDPLRFWITVSNQGSAEIDDVRLEHFDTPGFTVVRRCWIANAEPECGTPQGAAASSDANVLAEKLMAGESRTVWGDLESNTPNEKQKIVAVVGWTGGPKGTYSTQAAALGDAASVSTATDYWNHIRGFVRDFGIPIVLVLITGVFALLQQRREKVAKTWDQMLPESHKIAKKYYMPMVGFLSQGMEYADNYLSDKQGTKAPANLRRAFYSMTMFRWYYRSTRTVGGYFFKSRIGEDLVGACFKDYYEVFASKIDRVTRLTKLMDKLTSDETLAAFEAMKTSDQQIFDDAHADFVDWLDNGDYAKTRLSLKGFGLILEYEANRPYQYWYGKNKPLEMDDRVREKVEGLPLEKYTCENVEEYIAGAKKGK